MSPPDRGPTQIPPLTRRQLVAALGRPIGAATVLLIGYFLLPINRDSNFNLFGLFAGVALLGGFCFWETMHFRRSEYPVMTAIEMVAALAGFYIVTFAAAYFMFSEYGSQSFTERLTRVDALYFCLTVFTTTGFGDIAATSQPARVAVSIQMASTLVLLGLGVRFLNLLVNSRVRPTADDPSDP